MLDAGVNVLFTAFWYNHRIELAQPPQGIPEDTSLYGPLCMNIDVVRSSVTLPPLRVGDQLVVSPVGAYNNTQWLQFIEYRPNVVLIHEDSEVSVIRRAEDLQAVTALSKRVSASPPYLLKENPALPELSYERARLLRARGAEPQSVPLRAPFFGTWQVYQGFDGPHTHQPPWQHALDFIITSQGRSYRGQGRQLQDYLCFDLPVLSPCHGTVARCRTDLPDNPPGEVDNQHNWGTQAS